MKIKKIILRKDGDTIPYLVRYTLFSCRAFKICLHHILANDDDCLHDHPWNFISVILWRGYIEKTVKPGFYNVAGYGEYEHKLYRAPRFLYRPAEWKHSLELIDNKPAWTLVIMFRRRREWGFWNSKGFIHHSKYISNQKCD